MSPMINQWRPTFYIEMNINNREKSLLRIFTVRIFRVRIFAVEDFQWYSKKSLVKKKRKAHKKNWSGIWNFLLAFIFLFLHFAAQFMAPKKSHCVLDDWIRDSLSSTIHTYHKCRALEKHHSYYSSSCFLTNIIGSWTSCGILLCASWP